MLQVSYPSSSLQ